jgi:hypothetical protein
VTDGQSDGSEAADPGDDPAPAVASSSVPVGGPSSVPAATSSSMPAGPDAKPVGRAKLPEPAVRTQPPEPVRPAGHALPTGTFSAVPVVPPVAALVPAAPWRPAPPVRRWPLWLSVALVAILLAGALPVIVGAALLDALGHDTVGVSADVARSPRPGDPPEVTGAWLRQQVGDRLAEQSAALLRGDEQGFVSVADGAAVVSDLRRRYAALRALGVTVWRPEITAVPTRTTGDGDRLFWRIPVTFHHCFVTPDCATTPVVVGTHWADDGVRPRLVRIERSVAADHGPRPWETTELVAAAGRRTVVATTVRQRKRLPALLQWAEQAAAVADRYAVDRSPPDRYRVFLAGEREWKSWYGGGLPDWTSGYAIPLHGGQFEVVLNPAQLAFGSMAEVLRHELTHVASLPPGGYQDARNWWLVEGLADVAASDGRSVDAYPSLPDVRRLMATGGWNGRLDVPEPGGDTPDWQVSARYGIAYLAVRHLSDRFGQRDTLEFFERVVHDRRSPEAVSPEVLGQEWAAIRDDCVAYVRATAQ